MTGERSAIRDVIT